MPTTSDYGIGYLKNFYDAGMPLQNEQTVGATYKGFNDTLASWGSNRIMGQQCGQTWLQTFAEVNGLYNSGKQLSALQLVTWNDYEEGTEIESGINNCFSVSASSSGDALQWTVKGDESTVDRYVAYASTDGTNLMSLAQVAIGNRSLNLCSYSLADGNYTLYVQAVGKPSLTNQMSSAVNVNLSCGTSTSGNSGFTLGANPKSINITPGSSGQLTVSVAPQSGSFNNAVGLACSGLPSTLKCSFAPSTLVPRGSMANSVLTISAASLSATMTYHERGRWLVAEWLFGVGLFGTVFVGKTDRRRSHRLIAVVCMMIFILSIVSCGGRSANMAQTTPVQASYTVTINGNSGSIQLSTPITVTVR
jgi:hypothetical protein